MALGFCFWLVFFFYFLKMPAKREGWLLAIQPLTANRIRVQNKNSKKSKRVKQTNKHKILLLLLLLLLHLGTQRGTHISIGPEKSWDRKRGYGSFKSLVRQVLPVSEPLSIQNIKEEQKMK